MRLPRHAVLRTSLTGYCTGPANRSASSAIVSLCVDVARWSGEDYVNALERSRVFYDEPGYRVEFASDLYGVRTDMELVSEMAAFFGE